MKKILLILLFTIAAFSENIERYIVNAFINDKGRVVVREEILYNFGTNYKHGIYRDIPKQDTYIKNISVKVNNHPATVKVTNKRDFVRIRIGNPNRYVTGLVNYQISYKLDGMVVREDKAENKNKIILDLIGTGWRVPIKFSKIIVYLPKVLEGKTKIRIYKGFFGSKNSAPFQIANNKILVIAKNLAPHENITISLAFDKSLIKADKKPSQKYYEKPPYYLILAPILLLFYYFAKKFNIFRKIGSIAIKYNPPKGITILEAGVVKDNFLDFKELKAAILELANLGYLKIKEIDGTLYLKKTDKEDYNLSEDQKLLLDEIFKDGSEVEAKSLIISDATVKNLKETLQKSLVRKGIFNSSVRKARESFVLSASLIALFTIIGLLFYIFKDTGLEYIFPVALSMGFIAIGFIMLFANIKKGELFGSFFAIAWIAFSAFFLFNVVYSKDIFISIIVAVAIISIGIYFIYKNMNTLSLKGTLLKRDLLGLKEFIAKAEKDKIAYFLKEDKHFLDKLLPFAVLFGLNKHWINLYHELNADLPVWYDGDYGYFDNIDNDFNVAPLDLTPSAPAIDSSDFGSFGDFSGGGIGGGGGDSW